MKTDFSKIGKSNRGRGASYERKIAHLLTDSLGIKFKRSPRSGALLREGAFNGAFLGGDLCCEKDFDFSIECKNCAGVNLVSILKNPTTALLIKYWCQCVYDARIANKKPLLFFNVKLVRADYVCVCADGFGHLRKPPTSMHISKIDGPVDIKIDNKDIQMTDLPDMYIMTLESFLQNFSI